jgi:hypothetical protein
MANFFGTIKYWLREVIFEQQHRKQYYIRKIAETTKAMEVCTDEKELAKLRDAQGFYQATLEEINEKQEVAKRKITMLGNKKTASGDFSGLEFAEGKLREMKVHEGFVYAGAKNPEEKRLAVESLGKVRIKREHDAICDLGDEAMDGFDRHIQKCHSSIYEPKLTGCDVCSTHIKIEELCGEMVMDLRDNMS